MKKTRLKKIAVAACAMAMIVPMAGMALTGCGDNTTTPPSGVEDVAIVTSLTLNTSNCKTSFAYKEAFTYAGLAVTANFSDGTSEVLPITMCTVSSPDMTVAGTKTVTVTYKNNIKATYSITVAERQLPSITAAPLAEIDGDDVYRIEAEDIDLDISGVKAVEGKQLIIDLNAQEETPEEVETQANEDEVSGGKYLANYGVEDNYFGFKFTADKEYKNATLVFRAANPTAKDMGIGANMNVYLNYQSSRQTGKLNIADVTALPAAQISKAEEEDGEDEVVMEWATRILRNVTIPAGTNTLTFDVLGEDVVCLDYIEIYAGVAYGTNSVTELTGVGMFITDVEDFDLEKIVVREDVKNAHGLSNGQAFVENANTNPNGTHGGKAVGAMAKGSEITTALRLENKATVHILYAIANVGGYKVKDNYEFYIDGELMTDVEDYFVKAGNAGASQWWEWRDTSLGYVDLEAGDHIFTVKVTGSDCNGDCFKFDVLSYGEFIDHPEQSATISVNGLGTYVMEGENIDLFAEDGTQYIKSDNGYYNIGSAGDCSSGRFIGGFNAETQFIFTLYAFKDTTVNIAMRAVRPEGDSTASAKESVKITLNETEIEVSEDAAEFDNSEWRTITLAEGVELEGGKLYTFTMEVLDTFWLDNITFVTSEYNGETPSLGSIKLDTSAVTKSFDTNSTFAYDGLVVSGVQTNDVTFPVDLEDCRVTAPDMTTAGEKTVKVSYEGKEATYKIIVHGPVEGISLNTDGAKKVYNFGDEFSSKGITVTADTGAGTTMGIALDECVVSGYNAYRTGAQTITVKYGEFEATYEVTVNGVEAHATLNSESGTVTVEAENIDRRGVIQDAGNPTENWSANGQSGVSLRGVQVGSVLNIYIQAEEDITVNFIAILSKYEALNVKDILEITVDGETKIESPDLVLGRTDGNDWFNWKDADFGEIELSQGLHVISIRVIGAGPNMDCFKLEVKTAEAIVEEQ